MRKTFIVLLPSILLLVGVMAFTIAGKLKPPPSAKAIKKTIAAQKKLAFGCSGVFDVDDITGDIPPLPGWGNYSWKVNTTSDSAQFYFNQGINMYYGFHMIESIASFEKATKFDSTNAMLWYGRALSLGPTINDDATALPPVSAWQCAAKSKRYSAACTPYEKALIGAILQRYTPDTTIKIEVLRQRYTEAMKVVSETYSQNSDAVTLYADALMLQHPWDLYDINQQPKPWTPLIVNVLQHALAIDHLNPGANHYYIHALEGSQHPEQALRAAETLGTLMPGVSHVTHMPSHIYIRTGDYAKGMRVNDSAVANYDNYLALFAPVVNGMPLYKMHNVHLKATCGQMAGNYAIAMKASNILHDEMPVEYLTGAAVPGYVQYIYETPVLTQVRFGKWDDVLKQPMPDTNLVFAAQIMHFAKGVAFSRLHKFDEAQKEADLFNQDMNAPQLKTPGGAFSDAYSICLVAQHILEGVCAQEQRHYPQAIAALQKAVTAEDNLIYNEPRDWPLPARQFLGDVLLQTKAYSQAADVFNKELVINPKNGWSLTGLLLAYKGLGKKEDVRKTTVRLKEAFALKDSQIERPVF